MTRDQRTIADLRERVRGLEEEIALAVECCRLCKLCAYADRECTPDSGPCTPKWRGKK